MPSTYSWSLSAGDNATADSAINFAEGQLPGSLNDSNRQVMARNKEYVTDQGGSIEMAGSANVLSATLASAVTTYFAGLSFRAKATATNTGDVTLSVNALGARKVLTRKAGVDVELEAGQIQAGSIYDFAYSADLNTGAGGWIILGAASTGGGGKPTAVLSKSYVFNNSTAVAAYGAWTIHPLDTEDYDPDGKVTISSNTFTPTADGWVEWNANATVVAVTAGPTSARWQTRLYCVTDTAAVKSGTVSVLRLFPDSTSGVTLTSAGGAAVVASKVYRIEFFASRTTTDPIIAHHRPDDSEVGMGDTPVLRLRYWAD